MKKRIIAFLGILVFFIATIAILILHPKADKTGDNLDALGEAAINNGTVLFYSEPTSENKKPNIVSQYTLSATEFTEICDILRQQKWTSDALVDRLSFNFDGKMYCEGWLYFGYEQEVAYYDEYFCTLPQAVIDTLKKAESTATEYNDAVAHENKNPYFEAEVLEIYEKTALVEPLENEEIRKTADKITISLETVSTLATPELQTGDIIRIIYNGTIEESYPANIPTVFSIIVYRNAE